MSTTTDSSDSPDYSDDPTRTTTIRTRLKQRLSARTSDARGEVRDQLTNTGTTVAGVAGAGLAGYGMLRSVGAFRRWLTRIFEDAFALTITPRQARFGTSWLSSFVRDAYETGLRRARAVLRAQDYDISDRRAEAVLTDGGHQRTLRGLFERAHYDLDDAVSNAVQELSRTVAENGYLGGRPSNKADLAGFVTKRIRAQFGKRIRHVADLIPVRSANTAALTAYQRAGVERVGVDPEAIDETEEVDWDTANDDNVCAECIELARNGPYKLADVLAGNPAPPPSPHVSCRCWLVAI